MAPEAINNPVPTEPPMAIMSMCRLLSTGRSPVCEGGSQTDEMLIPDKAETPGRPAIL